MPDTCGGIGLQEWIRPEALGQSKKITGGKIPALEHIDTFSRPNPWPSRHTIVLGRARFAYRGDEFLLLAKESLPFRERARSYRRTFHL